MNPELETLIQAYDAVTLADDSRVPEALQTLDALLDKVVARYPHLDREKVMRAVHRAHRRWIRAQEKPPTIPPKG